MAIIKSILLNLNKSWLSNHRRYFSSKDIRNIGILAHIDAGKNFQIRKKPAGL